MEEQKFGTGGKRAGAGRRAMDPSDRMKYIQITLPEEMIKHAKAQRGGASAFIRRAIERYIETESTEESKVVKKVVK